MPIPDRRGFTLIEIIAALLLIGLAMIGGLALIDQIGDSAGRIAQEASRAARDGNGRRLLRRLLLDAAPSTDTTKRFRGDAHSMELSTRCEVPAGWTEPCRAMLALDERQDTSAVLAELSTGESYALLRKSGSLEFRYFNPTPIDTFWVRQWSSNVTLPTAVGLIVGGRDTIVFPVSVVRE
jgi:prepilin-type N-terminal cleavage/methylation domain-containing protein